LIILSGKQYIPKQISEAAIIFLAALSGPSSARFGDKILKHFIKNSRGYHE